MTNYLILSLYLHTLFPTLSLTHMGLASHPCHSVTHNKVNMEADTVSPSKEESDEKAN